MPLQVHVLSFSSASFPKHSSLLLYSYHTYNFKELIYILLYEHIYSFMFWPCTLFYIAIMKTHRFLLDYLQRIAAPEKDYWIKGYLQVVVSSNMEKEHSTLSLRLNAATKPVQNAWSSYLRILKGLQQQCIEEDQNSKCHIIVFTIFSLLVLQITLDLNLIDIYRFLTTPEYNFFLTTHGTFHKINHILCHKKTP